MAPVELMTLVAKSLFYPLKDITGPTLCYVTTYSSLWLSIYAHFITFFTTIFRYICLFHDDKMLKKEVTPKVSNYKFSCKLHLF